MNQVYVISFSEKAKSVMGKDKKPTLGAKPLHFFVFNSKSNLLVRKLDQRHALDVLLIKETVDYLLTKHSGFKQQKGSQIFDYESF